MQVGWCAMTGGGEKKQRRRNIFLHINDGGGRCKCIGLRLDRRRYIRRDNNCVTTGLRRQRNANKKSSISSWRNDQKRQKKAVRIFLVSACCAYLSLSARSLRVVDASSASGNSGNSGGANAPFLVVSEITVQSEEAKRGDTVDNNIPQSILGNIQNGRGGASTNANTRSGTVVNNDVNNDTTTNRNKQAKGADSERGSPGSDTDGEDEDKLRNEENTNDCGGFGVQNDGADPSFTSSAADTSTAGAALPSQPLRTLKRLQAMLDDSDYATHTVASGAAVAESTKVDDRSGSEGEINAQATSSSPRSQGHRSAPRTQAPSSSSLNPNAPKSTAASPSSPTEKLWTSKDRAKYRRTRRTEKQRQEQQQREYEEQQARKLRDIQRQRIIREERERKDLEELHRKQEEDQRNGSVQQQFLRYDESEPDFTDDDTDSQGFELPNLPVYLSDAEGTDDFSEETEEAQPNMEQQQQNLRGHAPIQPSLNYPPPNPQQGYHNMQPYYPEMQQQGQHQQQHQQQQQQPPPQQTNSGLYHNNYQNQYLQYPQQQQQQTMPQQHQYSPDHDHQLQQDNQQRHYEQQYAAWAQAAANGYYYPPPQPPSVTSFQHQRQAHRSQHAQQQAQHPQSSYPQQQHPYATQQQQQQDQGHSYAGRTANTHQSYPLLRQSSARTYSNIPPPPPPPHPRSQDAMRAAGTYQGAEPRRGIISSESESSKEQHEDYSRNIHDGGTLPNYRNNDLATPPAMANFATEVDPMTVLADELTQARTNVTTSSTNSQMTVNSAFVSPAAPLISSPIVPSSKVAAVPINTEESELIAGTESRISFDSIQKLWFSMLGIALLSYCAVSPRSLPFPEYNRLFLQNLSIVWLAAIAPVVGLRAVYDGKYNNINTVINTFYVSFTLGYALAFIGEIILTTVVRISVFKIWEPAIFSLTPEVPSIILPWVLREKQYKPKRITLFAADFAASCVASPIIEEYLKLKMVQLTCELPRNFKRIKNVKKRRAHFVTQPVRREEDDPQVVNINCYVTQMLAASLGLKLFDVSRRILMYTKETDQYKHLYAILRGMFPIHELCGTITALLLARRDVLGVNLPEWQIIGPAVLIHALANFRGMKPIFKWNSSAPWSEMQINQLKKEGNGAIWKQLLPKSYSKLVWMTILCRSFGYSMKNYYLIGRQAMKRTTTYSGKLHAFNAKLRTDSMLKRQKD